MTRLGIIGGGNMGEALIGGLLKGKLLEPAQLLVSDLREERLEALSGRYKVKTTRDNLVAARECETLVMAVKPQQVREVLDEIGDELGSHHLLISIAAGIPIRVIETKCPRPVAVIRVMPNTPASVQEVAAGIALGSHATPVHRDMVVRMFNAIGEAVVVDEAQMDAVTALSGSGPAYLFHMVAALVEAGVAEGLPRETAQALAVQTMYGAARMLSQTLEDPVELRKKVTSAGGTTEAALKVLDAGRWNEILREAVHAARVRSEELAAAA